MAEGERAIGVAIAAVAREPRLGFDPAIGLAVGVDADQRRAGRHHRRLGEAGAFARAQGPRDPFARRRVAARRREAAQPRALAVAEETLAGEGLRHHAVDRLAAMGQPDQRAPGRQAGDEALGAVDRVEHPDIFGLGPVLPVFFADDAVGGEGLRDQPPHRRLGAAVGFGDRIEHAAARLVLGADGRAEEGKDHLAGNLRETVDEACEVDRGHADRPKSPKVLCVTCIPVMPRV